MPTLIPAATSGIFASAIHFLTPLPRRTSQSTSPASKLSSGLVTLGREQTRTLYRTTARSTNDLADAATRRLAGTNSLTGTWRKDKDASDSMQEACDVVALPWVLRQAINVLDVLRVEDTDSHFATRIVAGPGGILDVKERYPWTGEVVEHGRRDKRRGKHIGNVIKTENGGHPCIQVQWEDPYGGVCSDEFRLTEDGMKLEQVTDMKVGEKRVKYTTVFRRARQA